MEWVLTETGRQVAGEKVCAGETLHRVLRRATHNRPELIQKVRLQQVVAAPWVAVQAENPVEAGEAQHREEEAPVVGGANR